MQMNKQSPALLLKPLILSCWPESGAFLLPEELGLSSAFAAADVAVSYSAQQNGMVRQLAFTHKTFVAADCESLILRLNTYDLLLVFPLSLNTLAKFALGLRDSFPAELLWKFSELGKPILLYEKGLPDDRQTMNPHLLKIYRRYWQQLIGGTVAGFDLDNLSQISARLIRAKSVANRLPAVGARVFITRDDIIEASASLEPLLLPSNAVVTDVAREEAEARGVVIVQG